MTVLYAFLSLMSFGSKHFLGLPIPFILATLLIGKDDVNGEADHRVSTVLTGLIHSGPETH